MRAPGIVISLLASSLSVLALSSSQGLAEPDQPAATTAPADPTPAIERAVASGEAIWKKSCKRTDSPLGCWRVKRVDDTRYCGDGYTRITWTRDPKAHDRAMRHFQKAIDLAEAVPADDPARDSAHRAARTAYLRRAESALEQAMAMRFPADLDFPQDQPETTRASSKRFAAWLKATTAQLQNTISTSSTLATDPRLGATSEERVRLHASVAVLHERYADVLEHGWVPRSVRTGPHASETRPLYCETIAEQAEPLHERSFEAYRACAALVERESVAGAVAESCVANAIQ